MEGVPARAVEGVKGLAHRLFRGEGAAAGVGAEPVLGARVAVEGHVEGLAGAVGGGRSSSGWRVRRASSAGVGTGGGPTVTGPVRKGPRACRTSSLRSSLSRLIRAASLSYQATFLPSV